MMKEQIQQILERYKQEKNNDITNNRIANLIRHELPQDIKQLASISDKYKIEGSPGRGQWAEIPWISIFDKDITSSAQRGYYVIYLFNSKMKGVYLSLNQGWTQYEEEFGVKNGRQEIKKNTLIFKSLLRGTLTDISFTPINLDATKTLGKAYELGHICGKYYPKSAIPDDNVLVDDLRNLIGVYREVKSLVGSSIQNLRFSVEAKDVEEQATSDEKISINKRISQSVNEEDIEKLLSKFEKELTKQKPKIRRRMASVISRNQKIANLVKERANYICEICGVTGFDKEVGGKYAEAHHLQELSKSRIDLPSNIICVCPLCHRIIHYGSESELEQRKSLKKTHF